MFMKINTHSFCRNMPFIFTSFEFYKIIKIQIRTFFGVEQIVTWCFNLTPDSTFLLMDPFRKAEVTAGTGHIYSKAANQTDSLKCLEYYGFKMKKQSQMKVHFH